MTARSAAENESKARRFIVSTAGRSVAKIESVARKENVATKIAFGPRVNVSFFYKMVSWPKLVGMTT